MEEGFRGWVLWRGEIWLEESCGGRIQRLGSVEDGGRGGTKPRARRETSEAEVCEDWRSWRSKVVEGGELRG